MSTECTTYAETAEEQLWLTAVRRDFHQHPELGFEEHRTADVLARMLLGWGYTVERGLGKTGLVAQLRRGDGTKRLGIRADMDALPMHECADRPHRSRHDGKMHACGHDGHMTMLLGAARHLAQKSTFSGTLNLVFQPAEEGLGGAKAMMEDGLFERFPCDAIFGLHNLPGVPKGHLVFRSGPAMASSDYVTIVVKGTGGHGASPHRTVDPIVAGCSIVMALQTIVARNVGPLESAVITVGEFHGGTANNVIPGQVRLELSVRAIDPVVRATLRRRIETLVAAQAESFGASAEVRFREGYPVLVNSPAETDFAIGVARETRLASGMTNYGPPLTASDDFAYFLEQCPGSYFFLGTAAGECSPPVHNEHYDFNDDVLPVGVEFWIRLAEKYLV